MRSPQQWAWCCDGVAYVVTKRWKVWRDGRIPVTELLYVSDPSLAVRCFERLKLGILLRDRSAFLGVDLVPGL